MIERITKKILVLGGTGAMGESLVHIMANSDYTVTITSRKQHTSLYSNISYICGDAKDISFLSEVLQESWSTVIDFMSYRTEEFLKIMPLILNATDQYIFLSSARVYDESNSPLTEESDRLLDACGDKKYLETDEYALAKARQEDALIRTKTNYTIVRPSITYNNQRLQFGISEKEEWLYRVLKNRPVVIPPDILSVKTAMTWGEDVAYAIFKLIGNEKAYGEVIQIASEESYSWSEIFSVYKTNIEKRTNIPLNVVEGPSALEMGKKLGRYYQIRYARSIDRLFDCSKLHSIIGELNFTPMEKGLSTCIEAFLANPQFGNISWRDHAYFDKLSLNSRG